MIRQATFDDLPNIAKIHMECFPENFSTKLGKKRNGFLLSKFYEEYMLDAPELFLVAEEKNKKIIGFCMGYYGDRTQQKKRFLKNNFFRISFRMITLLIKGDKLAWKKLIPPQKGIPL